MKSATNFRASAVNSLPSSRSPWIQWSYQQLRTIVLLLFLLYFLLPFIWLLFAVTKSNAALFSTFGLWFAPDFNLWTNLQTVFTYDNGIFLTWLGNSVLYAVSSSIGAAILATLAGYSFAKFSFRGKTLLYASILGAILVPNTALALPIFFLMSKIQLINTPWAVILPSLVNPFGVYLMRLYASQSIPDELLQAARIDGAGEIHTFWRVALPLMVPGFITVLLFAFVSSWNNYFLPLVVLSDPQYYPLTVGLASWNAQASSVGGGQVLFSLVVTGALVSISILILAFLFLQRFWQSGLAMGSVKA